MDATDHEKMTSDLQEVYRRAYSYTLPYWERAEEYANAYDSVIDRDNWPTLSEVVIPHHFITVENQLPFMMEYLFPRTNLLSLKPKSEQVPYETVRKVESYYTSLLTQKLDLKAEALKTIKDALKLGTGYIRTKLKYETPRNEGAIIAWSKGVGASERNIIEGDRRLTVGVEYVPFGQVLSLGNGDKPCNGEHIVVRYATYKELKQMKEDDERRDESMWWTERTPEEIMNDARDLHYDHSIFPNETVMARLNSNTHTPDHNQNQQMDDSVVIPIVEYYLRGKVIHVANGRDIVYYLETNGDIESNLTKATPCPDSGSWFSDSGIQAAMNLSYGTNAIYNAMLDVMSMSMYPPRVIDVTAFGSNASIPDHGPYTTYEVTGDARNAVQYPQMPQLPNGILNIGDQLQSFHAQTTGQPQANQGMGSPGLVRSGVNAFESLMATPMGREKMAGSVLEFDFLKPLIKSIFNLHQLMFGDEDKFLAEEEVQGMGPDMAAMQGTHHVQYTITRDEFMHDWDFDLYLDSKMRNSMADQNWKMGIYDRLVNNQSVDQRSLLDWALGDTRLSQRLHATPEQIQQNMEREQQRLAMEAQAQAAGANAGAGQGQPEAGSSPTEQGMNGIIANA